MYIPSVVKFNPNEAHLQFGHERPTASLLDLLRCCGEAACTVVPEDEHGWSELLVWLPGVNEHVLDGLAKQEPVTMNLHSANYMDNHTYLVWHDGATEVRVDLWRLNSDFPSLNRSFGYGATFFNASTARYAAHHLGADGADSMLTGLQGAMTNSGPNYHPNRQWGDEFLEAHKRLPELPEPGVIVPTCVNWKLTK